MLAPKSRTNLNMLNGHYQKAIVSIRSLAHCAPGFFVVSPQRPFKWMNRWTKICLGQFRDVQVVEHEARATLHHPEC